MPLHTITCPLAFFASSDKVNVGTVGVAAL